jgi:hypothetical protein
MRWYGFALGTAAILVLSEMVFAQTQSPLIGSPRPIDPLEAECLKLAPPSGGEFMAKCLKCKVSSNLPTDKLDAALMKCANSK